MARTTAEEGEGEAATGSRSSSRASRRREQRNPEAAGSPTPPTVITRSRASQSESPPPPPPSRHGKRKRSGTAEERRGGRATGCDGEDNAEKEQEEEAAAPHEENAEKEQEEEEEAAAASASPPGEHASSGASSAVSSPLRWPSLPRVVLGETAFGETIFEPFEDIDPAIVKAYEKLRTRYFAKQDVFYYVWVGCDRQLKLASLDNNVRLSCFINTKLNHVRESATKTILQIAKVVLDGKMLGQSSGFLIEWDAESKIGVVLTSALVIQSKSPSCDQWLAIDEYAPHAKVCVHLSDKVDTTVVADLLHYDKHYNLAMFKISIDLSAQIPSFTSELKCAQEVFVLGRDEDRNLSIDHGSVTYKSPSSLHRHHYMFISCGVSKVVDDRSSYSKLKYWNHEYQNYQQHNCIPRPHVGMKFTAIILLDPPRIEKISQKCDVDAGLIVRQVSEGSVAEKLGVRNGDIIKSWSGKNISTTIELENFLLHIGEEHLDKGNNIGSNVDLSVGIFHIRKDSHTTLKLTVNVSNVVEVVARGTYNVTPGDCTPVDDDNMVQGKEATHGTATDEVGDIEISPLSEHGITVLSDEEVYNN
uniref:PDZ domain-containing protein n=1 Tax=Oryza punctata TaxID=4537 RepID=A0A0E0KNW2_ORYPU